MEFDAEGDCVPRKPRPSGQDARPRIRSGGIPRNSLSNGHAAMQSPDVAGLEQLRQTMQATLGAFTNMLELDLSLILPFWVQVSWEPHLTILASKPPGLPHWVRL
jgi:hypothetical protein